jgi:predicted nucleotidyltransferase component of viral defense system
MIDPKYKAQVNLLLTILPHVGKEKSFALKGGTAINLFARQMPRLSVDIDLTYTSITDDRENALKNISDALDRIEIDINKAVPEISITRVPHGQGNDVKLNCQTPAAHVKIEVNTVTVESLCRFV